MSWPRAPKRIRPTSNESTRDGRLSCATWLPRTCSTTSRCGATSTPRGSPQRLIPQMRQTDDMATPADAQPRTLGELRERGYRSRSVKEELRTNLLARLASEEPVFPGIVGYDDSVIPSIENAILAG